MIKIYLYIGFLISFCLSRSPLFIDNIDLAHSHPDQTIKIIGASKNDRLGGSVSRAGDINGDGIGDIILGTGIERFTYGPKNSSERILAYIVYGNKMDFPMLDLKYLNQSQGFKVLGSSKADDYIAVSGAGDFNGDGIDDIMIGDVNSSPFGRYGVVYIIFGKKGNLTSVNVDYLDSTQGVRIIGSEGGLFGYSISKAGDFNGDGINDIIIGNYCYSQDDVAAYVIFGSKDIHTDIDVTTLRSSQGIKIISENLDYGRQYSVSGVGDFNGDGVADISISMSRNTKFEGGAAYIIFGNKNEPSDTYLANPDGYRGIKLARTNKGINELFKFDPNRQKNEASVISGAGDINGDGLADVIIGAPSDDVLDGGVAYIIFGNRNGLSNINLDDLTNSQGITISGADRLGRAVSSIGDINNDGVDDVLIGAFDFEVISAGGYILFGRSSIGFAYVIYGSKSELSNFNIIDADYRRGFTIMGENKNDHFGYAVSSAGDIDGDGIHDLLVSAPNGILSDKDGDGVVYVILSSKLSYRFSKLFIITSLPVVIAVLIAALLIAFKVYQYVRRKSNSRPYVQVQ